MCFILVIALSAFATAAPWPAGQGAGFSIPLTKRGLSTNAASVHPKVERGGNGLPLMYENRWFGAVSVGDPADFFEVTFDTGSADTFLLATSCSTCQGFGKVLWDPSYSHTSVNWDEKFELKFLDGDSVSGELYTDTMNIAGLTATTQIIGAATDISSRFSSSTFTISGYVGMAPRDASKYNAIPLFETLVLEGKVSTPVFSMKLASPRAELYLGGVNTAKYNDPITYVSVRKPGKWLVVMDNVQGSDGQPILTNLPALIDSGSNIIAGPISDITELYMALGGILTKRQGAQTFYSLPCNSFPSLSFSLGGTLFQIPGASYKLNPVALGSSNCYSGIIGLSGDVTYWVMGQLFMQNFYIVFSYGKNLYDYDNRQVGFAQLASEPGL